MAPELAIMGHHLGDVIENVWPPASQGDMPTLLAYCIGGGGHQQDACQGGNGGR